MQKASSGVGIASMLYLKYIKGLFPYRFILRCLWAPRGFSPVLGSVFSDTTGGIAEDSNPTFCTSLMFSYVFEFI